MNEGQILFSLLRHTVCGEQLDSTLKDRITPEVLDTLYRLAAPHDLLHLISPGLTALGVSKDDSYFQLFHKYNRQAVFRYARLSLDYEQICASLEKAGIPYIPLKGSVLREWYPQAWMRTSSDIDILVRHEDLDTAASVLVENLGFSRGNEAHHDISMVSPTGTHLELHFTVENVEETNTEQAILDRVWEHAIPTAPGVCRRNLTDAMFYFYHITHMAKHLLVAECGIRPFLDLWILNHRIPHDRKAREALLAQGGMTQFARAAEALAEYWFSGENADDLCLRLETFALQVGTEQAERSIIAVSQQQSGSKLRFLLDKLFPSFSRMAAYYPILRKQPWLLPVYAVHRWFRLLFTGDRNRAVEILKTNAALDAEEVQTMADLMQQLGFHK